MSIVNLQIADSATVVVPSDSVTFNQGVLYVGVGGNVAVKTIAGEDVTFLNVPDGAILYVMISRVLLTGTTATNMLILR